jgi:hypothetical protein
VNRDIDFSKITRWITIPSANLPNVSAYPIRLPIPIVGTKVDESAGSSNIVRLGFKNARTDHVDVLVDRRGYRG